ncbi:hypothetical protein [Niabella aquatica]
MVTFEEIKQHIQLYTRDSIVFRALDFLHQLEKSREFREPVWTIFSLIRWAYLYTTDSAMKSPITDIKFNELLKLIRELQAGHNEINFKNRNNVNRSFMIIGFQQFQLQEHISNIHLERQIMLYLKLSHKFNIDEEFIKLTGLPIKSFLQYIYTTYLYLHNERTENPKYIYDGILDDQYFSLFYECFGRGETEKYLRLLTGSKKEDFEGLQKMTDEVYQLYETTFFAIKPFIRFKGKFHLITRSVFNQTVKHFIYQFLKQKSPQFPSEFGNRMEKYIELGIKEMDRPYLRETDLKRRFPHNKVCDFAIDNKILLEVKAIELPTRLGVIRDQELMESDLKTNIIKAYSQLIEVGNLLNPQAAFYGIIVTYKDMFLGFGIDAWGEFLKSKITEECLQKGFRLSVLPPENLFFLSIEDWDRTVQIVKNKMATLEEILQYAYHRRILPDITQSIMFFNQALGKYKFDQYSLTYVSGLINELYLEKRNES